MTCKHCNKEIFFDKEDGEWISNEQDDIGKYQTVICNHAEFMTQYPAPYVQFHKPDYFKQYLDQCNAIIVEKKYIK